MQSALPPQPPPPPMRIRPLSLSASSRATQTYMCGGSLLVGCFIWPFAIGVTRRIVLQAKISILSSSISSSIRFPADAEAFSTLRDGSDSTSSRTLPLINFHLNPTHIEAGSLPRGVFDLWSKGRSWFTTLACHRRGYFCFVCAMRKIVMICRWEIWGCSC